MSPAPACWRNPGKVSGPGSDPAVPAPRCPAGRVLPQPLPAQLSVVSTAINLRVQTGHDPTLWPVEYLVVLFHRTENGFYWSGSSPEYSYYYRYTSCIPRLQTRVLANKLHVWTAPHKRTVDAVHLIRCLHVLPAKGSVEMTEQYSGMPIKRRYHSTDLSDNSILYQLRYTL